MIKVRLCRAGVLEGETEAMSVQAGEGEKKRSDEARE